MMVWGISRWLCGLILACGLAQAAVAQGALSPVIAVENRVITQYELDQRIRLLDAFGTGGDLRAQARDGLIEDRLKQIELARFDVEVPQDALQEALEEFAGRASLSLPAFLDVLAQDGIDPATLRDFVSVGILWRDYIRSRFNSEVTISESDIDQAIAQQGNSRSRLEVLLSEIIIAAPPERMDAAQQAARQIAQMRSFAAFEDAARQVSALPSRDNGGRLDWLPLTNYPPQIRSIIQALDVGEVTEPIEIPNAIALFQLRGTREAVLPARTPISIDYALYYLPDDPIQGDLLRAQVDTCDDLYGLAQNQPPEVLERVTRPPADIPGDIALELARLDPNEISTTLTRNEGAVRVALMLCARNFAAQDDVDRDAIRNQLRGRRLAALSDALVADLRAAAVIRP